MRQLTKNSRKIEPNVIDISRLVTESHIFSIDGVHTFTRE
jgi:hypothetical protein